MKHEVTEQSFLKDIADHKMTILRDEELYRHIRFRKPDSSDMYFDIITWPGSLCYTGDMGTFVFQRLEDMFCFFRNSGHSGETIQINTGYWGEKCEAVDSRDGIREYSPDLFIEEINDWLEEYIADEEDAEFIEALKEAVEDEILSAAEDGEYAARKAVDDFEFSHDDRQVEIADFFETTLTVKTQRFIWCCYALAWGIKQYDQAKAATGE